MPVGRPSITTPNSLELRLLQQTVQNIEQRFRAVEAELTGFEATVNGRATSSATTLSSLQAAIRQIRIILDGLQDLPPISNEPAEDGDVLTWSVESNQYVPEAGGGVGGVYLPLVTGEVPPVLMYLPDGNLVYTRIE